MGHACPVILGYINDSLIVPCQLQLCVAGTDRGTQSEAEADRRAQHAISMEFVLPYGRDVGNPGGDAVGGSKAFLPSSHQTV